MKAYPSSTDKIKITFENQFIKDSGSYTYDITFPMAITANREIFGNVQRLDVKKTVRDFEDCRLYADNRLVMSGKGTVTSITQDSVKLQLIGGKSRIKFNSNFEKNFIDEIDYPDVLISEGVDEECMNIMYGKQHVHLSEDKVAIIWPDLSDSNIVGQKDVAVFSPVADEANEIIANRITVINGKKIKINGKRYPDYSPWMVDIAPQPYLLYILKKVMEYEGYSIVRNDIDSYPWNKLVIVNACKSGKIKDALPHWSVYTFLEEIRKFFNVSLVFDEVSKTVSIATTNELLSNNTVSYDCEDDFSVEHDDDGLDNLSTSNIEYDFDESANRDWREYIPAKVLQNNSPKEYESYSAMMDAAEKMDKRTRWTTIFKVGYDYYVWANLPKDGNPESEETEEKCTLCGLFNPIIRDKKSDNFQDLKICPAAVYQRRNNNDNTNKASSIWQIIGYSGWQYYIVLPSVVNDKEAGFDDMEEDDNGEYFFSIQDMIESGEDGSESTSENDSAKMPVAFVAGNVINLKANRAVMPDSTFDGEDKNYRVPMLYTDYRMYPATLVRELATLSLEALPFRSFGKGSRSFGNGTRAVVYTTRFGEVSIDKNNLITIKFITNEIPDPSKIYIFKSKRYICQKIEMNVTNDGIDKEKTGYFYEIL